MRVVQLLTQATGGPVDHAVDVAVTLAVRGHESHVVGPVADGTPRARAAGVEWHETATTSKRDVVGAARTAGVVRRLRPDVLHLQDRRAGWLGRSLAPGLPGTALVATLHGVPDGLSDLVRGNVRAAPRRRRDRAYYLTGERVAARWGGGRVVVPSRAVADYAVTHIGLPRDRVDVVPNGVDPALHGPTPLPEAPRAVWIGGLEDVKRPLALVDAVAEVPTLDAVLVGDGPMASAVARRVHQRRAGAWVRLTGRLADPRPEVAAASLYVLTSAAENCPMALLQAMSAGRPVVATAVGGVPEVVRDGLEGLLVPADDHEALVDALRRVAGDATLRTRLGEAARRRVESAYTLDACVDGLLRSYDQAREARPLLQPRWA